MANRVDFPPSAALLTSEPFPQRVMLSSGALALNFDAATTEYAQVSFEAPADLTGPFFVDLDWATTATSGTVIWSVQVEAVTPADALNVLTTASYAAANTASASAPASAGVLARTTVTLTNNDSLAAGDRVRLLISRDAPADTAAGDVSLLGIAFRDSA